MESFFQFVCQHADHAHFIIFGLLMLAGLNVPISEDFLLITAGAIANLCIPEHKLYLFAWVFAGCWISAWEAYAVGRILGPKLYKIKWFSHILPPERIDRLHHYYEKFGIFTFIIGRFIPGGVRNALFISSGLGKMPFLKFILRDGIACLISSTTIFLLGYVFAEYYDEVIAYLKKYNQLALFIFLALVTTGICIFFTRKSSKIM